MNEDVTSLSFEQALEELDRLTRSLEKGEIPLAEALTLYQRGKALLAHTEQLLAPLATLG